MSPLVLRQLWTLIEKTQTGILLHLDDSSLVQWLLRQLRTERSLNGQESDAVSSYIYSRLPLIRDLAQERS